MKRTWWFALLVLAPLIEHLVGLGSAQPAAAALGARCSSSVPCSSGMTCDTSTLGATVGVCVAQCTGGIVCKPGEIADTTNGCICVAQVGPGRHCDGACTGGESCVTFAANAFGPGRTPGGGVCVPATTPTCSPTKNCPAGTKCAFTSATQGICAPAQASPTAPPCRFDERFDSAANACKRLDPIGASCAAGCSLAGASRTCAAAINKCTAPGTCASAETCGNGLDDDCNSRVDECARFCVDTDRDGYCTPGSCRVAMTAGANQVPEASCAGNEPGSCDADAGKHPGAPPVCGTDTDCNGNALEGCPNCEHTTGPFTWSCFRGTTSRCVAIVEPSDPHTWTDNFLCTTTDLGLRWSVAGPIAGMRCTKVYEEAEPPEHAWHDNWLCLPMNSKYELTWSQAGPKPGWACVQWDEPADPHAWSDNYLCWKKRPEDVPCPANDRDCKVCPGPDKHLCCTNGEFNHCGTTKQCENLHRPGKPCDPRRNDRIDPFDR